MRTPERRQSCLSWVIAALLLAFGVALIFATAS